MAKRAVVHVVPNSKSGWDVKHEGAQKPLSHHRTQENAIDAGRKVAKAAPLGQIKIHGEDGKIRTEHTYGQDPEKTPG